MENKIKKCPFCAEDIKLEAVKCKHCGSELEARGESKVKEEKNKIDEDEELQKENKSLLNESIETEEKIKKIALVFFFFMIIGLVWWFYNFNKNDSVQESPPKETSSQNIYLGDIGILNNNDNINDCSGVTILAITKEGFKEMTDLVAANDKYGFSLLVESGRVEVVDNCKEVKIIETGFGVSKVRFIDNPNKTGWVSYEFVRKK